MKIVYFDGNIIDEPELSYKSQDTLLGKMIENTIIAASVIHDADIEVVLIDNVDLFGHWNAPEGSLGFHAINAGVYEYHDEDCLSTAHRVVIFVDENKLIEHIKEESALDFSDHRDEYLEAYLVTVTHELTHCMEFIKNSGGLTPSEAQNLYECDELEYTLQDLSTGHGILFPYDENLSDEDLVEIMEYRVEKKGRDWLRKCEFDWELFNQVIDHYSPEEFRLQ